MIHYPEYDDNVSFQGLLKLVCPAYVYLPRSVVVVVVVVVVLPLLALLVLLLLSILLVLFVFFADTGSGSDETWSFRALAQSLGSICVYDMHTLLTYIYIYIYTYIYIYMCMYIYIYIYIYTQYIPTYTYSSISDTNNGNHSIVSVLLSL